MFAYTGRVICGRCSTDNRQGAKFCRSCGASLAAACAQCGAPFEPGQPFCDECGAALAADAAPAPGTAPPPAAAPVQPVAERRLVSVLFADLVGFTTLSEGRDSEEVRDLQSRYFETCRRLIELYGGVVEKFIGDAVMAVWGAHTATEDDAERAVRAGLDLVAAVSALGDEVGVGELRARAGVLTGEATVTVGAQAEGMVTGDIVNTASRVQSLADPGQVLVGDPTRRATEPAVVYEDVGAHELKGKEGLHRLWRAVRVVSGARGALKSEGLEAPFVGRDRELRQIKDLFHACADEKRAHLVSVTGIAGIGKSRLVWEFDKYMDGIAQIMYWQRGRCLSYGEGVTYWALADMVRMRCRISEDDATEAALEKLRAVLEEHVGDADERAFVEPRVAHLLGLEEGASFQREELFAAWRAFFERLADVYPTVLAFEDMQWADASLLDFIEYLLEWARQSPIFVVTSARPELLEKRPTWGAGKRNFTSIYLEPLSEQAMQELLTGLVPGLPRDLRDQILARAEGVPLYAVETVRMLIDRGALVREGSAYRPAGQVESLEVPETLHALIAARLDGLTADERRLVQDGAILGKTFAMQAVAALSGMDEADVEPVLAALVRKEVLSIQADPRSPEHGQYGFLQDLVRHVATETLSKRERYARHLAAADYLERAFPGDEELVEVLASHYREAYAAQPNEDGAEAVRDRARELLVRAGRRAESLGAPSEAGRYYEGAYELTDDLHGQAGLLQQAAGMAERMAAPEQAVDLYRRALEIYERLGDTHAAAGLTANWTKVDERIGHLDQAIERMERIYSRVADDEPDEPVALLTARLAASLIFAGDVQRAAELCERAVTIAESLGLPEVLVVGWLTKGLVATSKGRPHEAAGFYRMVVETGMEHGLLRDAATATGNLSDLAFHRDRYQDAVGYLEQSRALAAQIGSRPEEWFTWTEMSYVYYMLGQWDDALAALAEVPEDVLPTAGTLLSPLTGVLELHLHRGDIAEARRLLGIYHRLESSVDVQERSSHAAGMASLRFAEGRYREALEAGRRAMGSSRELVGAGAQDVKQALVWSIEAAFALDEPATADELLTIIERLKSGLRPPYLDAHANRLRARMADREGALERMRAAADGFRRLGIVFWLAVTELEGAELLLESDPGSDEAQAWLAEAAEIFSRLGAKPWLDRLAAVAQRADPALDPSV